PPDTHPLSLHDALPILTAERRMRSENRIVTDVAVVCDVHVRHEHVAIADRRHAAAPARPAIDRDEFAKNVLPPDHEARLLALIRSEEHTSELQSIAHPVRRPLLATKKCSDQ